MRGLSEVEAAEVDRARMVIAVLYDGLTPGEREVYASVALALLPTGSRAAVVASGVLALAVELGWDGEVDL